MLFTGTYHHTVDDKGRVAVPSRYRAELGEGVVLTLRERGAVTAYTTPAWNQAAAQLMSIPGAPTAQDLIQSERFFRTSQHCELDGHGRVMLPPGHRGHAGISDRVVITGAGAVFHLRGPDAWSAYETAENATLFSD